MPPCLAMAADGRVILAQVRGLRAMPEWPACKPSEFDAILATPFESAFVRVILPFILLTVDRFLPACEGGQSDGGSEAHRHAGGNR